MSDKPSDPETVPMDTAVGQPIPDPFGTRDIRSFLPGSRLMIGPGVATIGPHGLSDRCPGSRGGSAPLGPLFGPPRHPFRSPRPRLSCWSQLTLVRPQRPLKPDHIPGRQDAHPCPPKRPITRRVDRSFWWQVQGLRAARFQKDVPVVHRHRNVGHACGRRLAQSSQMRQLQRTQQVARDWVWE